MCNRSRHAVIDWWVAGSGHQFCVVDGLGAIALTAQAFLGLSLFSNRGAGAGRISSCGPSAFCS